MEHKKLGLFWETSKRNIRRDDVEFAKPVDWSQYPTNKNGYEIANKSHIAEWRKLQTHVYCEIIDGYVVFCDTTRALYLLLPAKDERISWLLGNLNIIGFDLQKAFKLHNIAYKNYIDLQSISPLSSWTLNKAHRELNIPLIRFSDKFDVQDKITGILPYRIYVAAECLARFQDEIERRAGLGVDSPALYSMLFSTLAEEVFLRAYANHGGRSFPPNNPTTFKFKRLELEPEYKTDTFRAYQSALDETFNVTKAGMSKVNPIFDRDVKIAGKSYSWGKGGLHSKQRAVSYFSGNGKQLVSVDVYSNYPSIILTQGVYPDHMPDFLKVYREFYDKRANATGVQKRTCKDILNVIYGKFNSEYSPLYCPHNMLQVTLTGQIYLLCLIEMLAHYGIETVSANTDGLVLYADAKEIINLGEILFSWSHATGLTLTQEFIQSAHYQNVLSYILIQDDVSDITKGGVLKDESQAVIDGVKQSLRGQPIGSHIEQLDNLKDFSFIAQSPRCAMYQDGDLSKLLGYNFYAYLGNPSGKIYECDTLENIPKFSHTYSEGVDIPLDKSLYIEKEKNILKSLGLSVD